MIYNIFNGGTGRIDPICHVIGSESPDVAVLFDATHHEKAMTIARNLNMAVFPAQSPRHPDCAIALLSKWEITEAGNLAAVEPFDKQAILQATICGPDCLVMIGAVQSVAEGGFKVPTALAEAAAGNATQAAMRPAVSILLLGGRPTTAPTQDMLPQEKARGTAIAPAVPRSWVAGAGAETVARLEASGWMDAQTAGGNTAAPIPNYPTNQPAYRNDYIFIKNRSDLCIKNFRVVQNPLARFASDHFPICADIVL